MIKRINTLRFLSIRFDQLMFNTQFCAVPFFTVQCDVWCTILHKTFQLRPNAMPFQMVWLNVFDPNAIRSVFVSIFIWRWWWWRSFNQHRKYSCISFLVVCSFRLEFRLSNIPSFPYFLARTPDMLSALLHTYIYTHITNADTKPAKSSGVDRQFGSCSLTAAHSSQSHTTAAERCSLTVDSTITIFFL